MSSFPALIAGHSQAKYFGKYLSLPDTDVLSFSGYRIDMMFKEIQPTVRNYQTIVLHVGANDLSRGTTVKTTLRKLQQLTSDIWDINQTATILLSGLQPRVDNQFPGAMPRRDFLQDLNNRAYQVNNCLASLQTQIPKIHYVSHSSFVQHGEIQRHLLSRDGLHLSFKGTAQVVADIEKAVLELHNTNNKHLGYSTTNTSNYSNRLKFPGICFLSSRLFSLKFWLLTLISVKNFNNIY